MQRMWISIWNNNLYKLHTFHTLMKKRITISLDNDLFETIETDRNGISRSTYINDIINKFYMENKENGTI